MNLFDQPEKESQILFEKSANYFTESNAPLRIKTLLKNVKLIMISIDPVQRAYSWYQHMKSHNDKTAFQFSFYEILMLNSSNQSIRSQMKSLRTRCLDSGLYSKHLKNWLKYFTSDQIIQVDGELLRRQPYKCLNDLQKKLGLETEIDFKKMLKYNKKKGFYCVNGTKCLGQSKGRQYPALDLKSKTYLVNFYRDSNRKLLNLFKKYAYSVPTWLKSL